MEELYMQVIDDLPLWLSIARHMRNKPYASGVVVHLRGEVVFMDQRARSIMEPPAEATTIWEMANTTEPFISHARQQIEAGSNRYIFAQLGRCSRRWKILEMLAERIEVDGQQYRMVFVRELMQNEVERCECLRLLAESALP